MNGLMFLFRCQSFDLLVQNMPFFRSSLLRCFLASFIKSAACLSVQGGFGSVSGTPCEEIHVHVFGILNEEFCMKDFSRFSSAYDLDDPLLF